MIAKCINEVILEEILGIDFDYNIITVTAMSDIF